jgi:hypothetical protein
MIAWIISDHIITGEHFVVRIVVNPPENTLKTPFCSNIEIN